MQMTRAEAELKYWEWYHGHPILHDMNKEFLAEYAWLDALESCGAIEDKA